MKVRVSPALPTKVVEASGRLLHASASSSALNIKESWCFIHARNALHLKSCCHKLNVIETDIPLSPSLFGEVRNNGWSHCTLAHLGNFNSQAGKIERPKVWRLQRNTQEE